MYKIYTEMREWIGQPTQRILTATKKVWRVGLERKNNLEFCNGYNMPTVFFKSMKEVFSMQGVYHPANILLTIVHGQAFNIIIWHPPNHHHQDAPLSAVCGWDKQLCGFEFWEPSPICNVLYWIIQILCLFKIKC